MPGTMGRTGECPRRLTKDEERMHHKPRSAKKVESARCQ